jgi:coenzyme F420 hydrogenase subunit beta
MITQLLVFALEEGIIDGALVTKMDKERPLEPHPFIARTREEILEASRSKYCPVPANVVLREIMRKDGKYAVVGLPCHIHGLRKAERFNKKLKERVIVRMGLFCTRNASFLQTEYLLHRWGIEANEVKKITFRGGGWPGVSSVLLKSGEEKNHRYMEWASVQQFCLFAPGRCLLCCDGTAELADISFGDAWLPKFSNDRIGTSAIVSRTLKGEQLLHDAAFKKKICLRKLSALEVAKSQGMMRFKKNSLSIRFLLFKMCGKAIPTYNTELLKPGFVDYPRSGAIFVNQYLASKYSLWGALEKLLRMQDSLKKIYKTATSRMLP